MLSVKINKLQHSSPSGSRGITQSLVYMLRSSYTPNTVASKLFTGQAKHGHVTTINARATNLGETLLLSGMNSKTDANCRLASSVLHNFFTFFKDYESYFKTP